jgi:CMP-N,N'-diacetyllegionaminic acid synthase
VKALAVIPARGGSRGIPKKNMAPLAGKPLIAWTIEAAVQARRVGEVVVSSDDADILRYARRRGVIALERPAELATDSARSEPVLMHAIEATGTRAGEVVLLQPTSPLRDSTDVDDALAMLDGTDLDAVISVLAPDKNPFKAFYADPDTGFLRPVATLPNAPFLPRQALPEAFFPNGAIYAVRTRVFRDLATFLPPRTAAHRMPAERSIDIDDLSDLRKAESLLAPRPTTQLKVMP